MAIGAVVFLYTVMTCVGSCEGYFSFHGEGPRRGGKSLAWISPGVAGQKALSAREYRELVDHRQRSLSPVSTSQVQPLNRQKTSSELTHVPNGKNITIELPERLLTGRKMSPTTHERSLNKVVKNLGHVVQDATKRYNGDAPSEVIVQVDPNAKATVEFSLALFFVFFET